MSMFIYSKSTFHFSECNCTFHPNCIKAGLTSAIIIILYQPTPDYTTQNPGSSVYTQHWVLYTWDEHIMSISQVGKPIHEFEEDLSRS